MPKPAEGGTCNANVMVSSIVVVVPSPARRDHSLIIRWTWRKDFFQTRSLLLSLNEVAVDFRWRCLLAPLTESTLGSRISSPLYNSLGFGKVIPPYKDSLAVSDVHIDFVESDNYEHASDYLMHAIYFSS